MYKTNTQLQQSFTPFNRIPKTITHIEKKKKKKKPNTQLYSRVKLKMRKFMD